MPLDLTERFDLQLGALDDLAAITGLLEKVSSAQIADSKLIRE
jgi:hypothetical protein